jgi:hypothetical protein
MLKRLPLAVLAAAIVAVFGFAGTAAPASADQDNHHVKGPGHPAHWNRPANPYGANGYWSNGSWHNRANPGRHYGWNHHPKHPKHPKHHAVRDRD